ncbi:MAG: nucleotidyltransferase family protein [Candidatus Omnitrophica bacterium]|nr:nucleotidyltransferase family protein [Candidatus Omnitrophota bacterium]
MYTDLSQFCIDKEKILQEAITLVDRSRLGIVLVVDEERHLIGTITDGDVRRAMLAKFDMSQPLTALLERKARTVHAHPIAAPAGADRSVYLNLLRTHGILHLPILDEMGQVTGLVTMQEFLPEQVLPLHAVVMAGGLGTRLHPLTEDTPKPMLRVGDRPLLEIIIRQLREAGIREVKITTHHKPEKIEAHFGDGKNFGVKLSYVEENQPLGTIGSLGLLEVPQETTLVINGDILTRLDIRAMLAFHKEHKADLTVAVRHYDVKVPYGVIECEGPVVRKVSEKPVIGFFVNAGIYLLDPAVYQYIPCGQRFDMTDLIQRILKEGRPVISFPIREYWLDIGQHADYEEAQGQVKDWELLQDGR